MPTPFSSLFSGVFVMIDNAVASVPASMNDENLDEEERRAEEGRGREERSWRDGGRANYLIV